MVSDVSVFKKSDILKMYYGKMNSQGLGTLCSLKSSTTFLILRIFIDVPASQHFK